MSDQTPNSLIDGILLGDASIPAGQNLLHFSQKADRREYVEFVARLLGLPSDRVKDRDRQPDSRTGKVYRCSELRTFSHEQYGRLRQRWYPDGVKVVPGDLQLTPDTVLHWFLCDGCGSISRSSAQVMFCTDSFGRDDIARLAGLLAGVGIDANVCNGNRLRVRQRSVGRFYQYIGHCPVKCLAYKWIPETHRKVPTTADLRPHYQAIHNLYSVNGWSCNQITAKFGTNYFSIRYVLKTHFGIRFRNKAAAETTCREGVVAPSETARQAPADRHAG